MHFSFIGKAQFRQATLSCHSSYFFAYEFQVPLIHSTWVSLQHLHPKHPIDFGDEEEGLMAVHVVFKP